MNVDNGNVEPHIDLELSLSFSNQCSQKSFKIESGAGANATSRVDMTFVATDPLSELVWSPDEGLSLRCADSIFANKKTSLFWDARPSNMELSPPKSIYCENSYSKTPIKTVPAVCAKGHQAGLGADMVDMDTTGEVSASHTFERETQADTFENTVSDNAKNGNAEVYGKKESKNTSNSGQAEGRTSDNMILQGDQLICSVVQNDKFFKDNTSGTINFSKGNQMLEIKLGSEIQLVSEHTTSGASNLNLASAGRKPLERLELTAENDLRTINCETASAAASKIKASVSANEIENSQNDETMPPKNQTVPLATFPTNSKIHVCQKNRKEKALSNGDFDRLNDEDDDSHESVESCNSAGLLSSGKRKWDFDRQLILESKRIKKQLNETPGSTSFIKRDSSFMNWISNMMKGFSQSIHDEAMSLANTVKPGNDNQWHEHNLVSCNKIQEARFQDMGFRSIFRSIYCPTSKNLGMNRMISDDQTGESFKDLEVSHKEGGIKAIPITCCAETGRFNKKSLQLNERFEGSTCQYNASPPCEPKFLPLNCVSIHESRKMNSLENKMSCTLDNENEGTIHSKSAGKQMQNKCFDAQSEEQATNIICQRSDPLESLWITRFSAKSTATLLNSDHLNQSTSRALSCSNDCMKLSYTNNQVACTNSYKMVQARALSTNDRLLDENKELKDCSVNTMASIRSNSITGQNDNKSICRMNPISSSQNFKNSEAIAFKFARRLDAFKHIMPSNMTDDTTVAIMTCFFCRRKGHQLRECPDLEGNDVEGLPKSASPLGDGEELSSLCIRCFQPNHWALECPNSSLRGQNQLDLNALVNNCILGDIQIRDINEENLTLQTVEEPKSLPGGLPLYRTDPNMERDLNLKWSSNDVMGSDALIRKDIASCLDGNKLKRDHISSSGKNIISQIAEVPKGIFDAIRKLRLSRTDIIKWMNSHLSQSHLNGLFLRLRLGKWEEGLGGTGYHVASITGEQGQSSEQNAKDSLTVNIGGIQCLVESQYISNHDFLEDELMAWWCATSRNGGMVPSKEYLIEKIEKKKSLGFWVL